MAKRTIEELEELFKEFISEMKRIHATVAEVSGHSIVYRDATSDSQFVSKVELTMKAERGKDYYAGKETIYSTKS